MGYLKHGFASETRLTCGRVNSRGFKGRGNYSRGEVDAQLFSGAYIGRGSTRVRRIGAGGCQEARGHPSPLCHPWPTRWDAGQRGCGGSARMVAKRPVGIRPLCVIRSLPDGTRVNAGATDRRGWLPRGPWASVPSVSSVAYQMGRGSTRVRRIGAGGCQGAREHPSPPCHPWPIRWGTGQRGCDGSARMVSKGPVSIRSIRVIRGQIRYPSAGGVPGTASKRRKGRPPLPGAAPCWPWLRTAPSPALATLSRP